MIVSGLLGPFTPFFTHIVFCVLFHEKQTVKVSCEPDLMQVNIRSNLLFRGRVYARDRPKTCFVDVGNSMDFSLPISLLDHDGGNDRCATRREVMSTFYSIRRLENINPFL